MVIPRAGAIDKILDKLPQAQQVTDNYAGPPLDLRRTIGR
jgi:hypothetical protein